MNDDDLAAFVQHVTHRPVPGGASQVELFAILAKRFELMEFAITRFQEQLTDVIASMKAVMPHTATDVPPGPDPNSTAREDTAQPSIT